MFRKALVILGSLALLLVSLSASGTAFAASSSDAAISNVDLAVLQKVCSVVDVHLDGPRHTITCQRLREKGVQPLLYRDDSCNSNIDNLVLYNYGYTGVLCFAGTGYLGVNIYDVNEVDDVGSLGAWFLYYPGHIFQSLLSGGSKYFGSGSATGIEVTQLCFGSSNPSHC